MKKIILAFTLLFSFSLLANEIDWKKIDNAFSTTARYEETQFGYYAILENFKEIPNGHHADYLSGVGGFNAENKFDALRYEMVSEAWVKRDGLWYIDQWLFVLNYNHQPTFMLHRKMVQTEDRRIVSLENYPEEEQVYQNKINDLLIQWSQNI